MSAAVRFFSCFNHSTGLPLYQHAVLYSHPTIEGSPGIMTTCTAAHFAVTTNLCGSSIIGAKTLCLVHRRRSECSLEVVAAAGRTLWCSLIRKLIRLIYCRLQTEIELSSVNVATDAGVAAAWRRSPTGSDSSIFNGALCKGSFQFTFLLPLAACVFSVPLGFTKQTTGMFSNRLRCEDEAFFFPLRRADSHAGCRHIKRDVFIFFSLRLSGSHSVKPLC